MIRASASLASHRKHKTLVYKKHFIQLNVVSIKGAIRKNIFKNRQRLGDHCAVSTEGGRPGTHLDPRHTETRVPSPEHPYSPLQCTLPKAHSVPSPEIPYSWLQCTLHGPHVPSTGPLYSTLQCTRPKAHSVPSPGPPYSPLQCALHGPHVPSPGPLYNASSHRGSSHPLPGPPQFTVPQWPCISSA